MSMDLPMIWQRTLKESVDIVGISLHSGDKVELNIRPAPADTGIVFRRVDLLGANEIKALATEVTETQLATCIGTGAAKISTVEHLMSAFAGLGIDNAFVDVNGPELPIMDGSAAPFAFLLQSAGIVVQQRHLKKFIRVKKPIEVVEGLDEQGNPTPHYKSAGFYPHEGFRIDFTIEYNHPVFQPNTQRLVVDFADQSYLQAVSRARTYGFKAEYEWMRSRNLALGGSLANAIVIDDYRILNEDGLRYEDEFVRHKILDAIGDIYMLGASLIGEFRGVKSGHALNNKLARTLLASQDAWEWVTFGKDTSAEVPAAYVNPLWEPVPA